MNDDHQLRLDEWTNEWIEGYNKNKNPSIHEMEEKEKK